MRTPSDGGASPKRSVTGALVRVAARPLRDYLDWRFERIEDRLRPLQHQLGCRTWLDRVDVRAHHAERSAPTFEHLVSQVVSAAQFDNAELIRWRELLYPGSAATADGAPMHRKHWEHAYILEAARQNGVLAAGNRAVGFGVGAEPIPAALARHGLEVLATDRVPADSAAWASSGQHLTGLDALRASSIVSDADLDRAVRVRYVDMRDIPDDVGRFHLVWSAGSLEHLGSPRAGLDFVLATLALVEPGGIAVHTTELELVPKPETRDYGHMAAYQPHDLDALVEAVRARGFEIDANWRVCLDRPADRWISVPPHPIGEPVHLKVVFGDSIVTSVGLLARRPA